MSNLAITGKTPTIVVMPHMTQQSAWRSRFAIGVPFTIVLALIVNFTLGAIHPNDTAHGVAAHGASRAAVHARLASLLSARSNPRRAVLSALPDAGPTPGSSVTLSPVGEQHPGSTKVHHKGGNQASSGMRMAPARDVVLVPETTVVAHLSRNVPGYSSANALGRDQIVPGAWYGYPSKLPVIGESTDRLHVRLAQRPDEATTWINKSDAVLTTSHWAIVVDIPQHWLYLFKWGQQVGSFAVGDGAAGTPTPSGQYFVAFHAPPNGPGYGSVMLETSAHSRAIAHFEGGNDAIIAIHGSIFSDSAIGDHGAAISNGCIRMHEWDLREVAHVVDGSPVFPVD